MRKQYLTHAIGYFLRREADKLTYITKICLSYKRMQDIAILPD